MSFQSLYKEDSIDDLNEKSVITHRVLSNKVIIENTTREFLRALENFKAKPTAYDFHRKDKSAQLVTSPEKDLVLYRLYDINDEEPHPFAETPHSNITKAKLGHETVALKTARSRYGPKDCRAASAYNKLILEGALWSSLDNVNIQPFLGLYLSQQPCPAIVTPFREQGNLLDYVKTYPSFNKHAMLGGVADGLTYLHTLEFPILHGDIRAMNILVHNGKPLISDFGSALVFDPIGTMSDPTIGIRGTGRWMAPEVLCYECDPDPMPITLAADVYSFAMTLIEVFSGGNRPFDYLATDGAVIIEVLINNGKPRRPQGPAAEGLSDALWELADLCLSHDPLQRPSMLQISMTSVLSLVSNASL